MPKKTIRSIGLIGTGRMGQSIAVAFARVGINVIFGGPTPDLVEKNLQTLKQSLEEQIEKFELTASEVKAILQQIKPTSDFKDLANVDLVIETIIEDREAKLQLAQDLDKAIPQEAIIATNTSSLSITEMASQTSRPEKVIGIHFAFPAFARNVVEVVRGLRTSQATFEQACDTVRLIGKEPVEVYESPGFVSTRTMMPFINEAIYLLMEGVATAEGIDKVLSLAYEMSQGPLGLADSLGLDVVMRQMENLFREFGDLKYRPCPLLRKMVRAGHLGRKSGEGFFKYEKPEPLQ